MDRYNDGAYAQTDGTSDLKSMTLPDSRGSFENSRGLQTPLEKKYNTGMRSASGHTRNTIAFAGTEDAREGQLGMRGPRKGSLRNAIRRVFGRRSRSTEPPLRQTSPSRHGYHRSEPAEALPPQPEEPEHQALESRISQRNFSIPLELPSHQATFPRTRSPYAVEFPQSSRLKPLNLGNPFDAPGSQLRRRKTLPSILVSPEDAAKVKAEVDDTVESTVEEVRRDPPPSQIGRAISTRGSDKRRSRSETDLRGALNERPQVPQRKRSDEIRYWRESYQPNVLRASGFRVRPAGGEEEEEQEKTPMVKSADLFDVKAGAVEVSPQGYGGLNVSQVDDYSSALGTELSRDLEDRVARLETGLRSFQASLEKLNADRGQRSVAIASTPEPNRSKSNNGRRAQTSSGDGNGRTASLLAGDLQDDLAPSNYQYDYTDTLRSRPVTSPPPLQTQLAAPFTNPTLPTHRSHSRAMDDPFLTSSSARPLSPETSKGAAQHILPGSQEPSMTLSSHNGSQMPQHTFKSLYEMLADERSARRRLEQTMRNLQEEIKELHFQVSSSDRASGGGFQSQRSSYMPSSSRLQALLAGTEESPPGSSAGYVHAGGGGQRFPYGYGGGGRELGLGVAGARDPRVVSRFSGSESEVAGPGELEAADVVGGVGGEEEEGMGAETPYEAYRTPVEERGSPGVAERFGFRGGQEVKAKRSVEGGMF